MLFLFRTAKESVEVAGIMIEEGERIILGIASANRDERKYECPNDFRLDRGIAEGMGPAHLSFGVGPHICLGLHFARMQGRVVLEAMLDRFGPGEVTLADGYQLHFVPTFLSTAPSRSTSRYIRGPKPSSTDSRRQWV